MPFTIAILPFIISIFSLILTSRSQSVVTVEVGNQGLFFTPLTVTAGQGDIVSFVFVGRNHSVTQSTFDDPCIPLDGGFSSGLAGVGNDSASPPPVWNLTITDDSEPIWYFCEVEEPASHCINGMVGAINPASQDDFADFLSAAKAVDITPSLTDTIALTGIGAEATEAPTTTDTSSVPSRPSGGNTSAPPTSSNSTSAFFSKPTTTSTRTNDSIRSSATPCLPGLMSLCVVIIALML